MGAHPFPFYDFVFVPDPGRTYRVQTSRNAIRLYRLAQQRWLFERVVPNHVAAKWYEHRLLGQAARGYLALPLVSEV